MKDESKVWIVKITHKDDTVEYYCDNHGFSEDIKHAKYYKNCASAIDKAHDFNVWSKDYHKGMKATILVMKVTPCSEMDEHFKIIKD